MKHFIFLNYVNLTVASPWIERAANSAIVKYPPHSKTAAAGNAISDSRIHSNSKANAIR